MYNHILLATDGTEVAEQALDHGLALAKSVGAKVTVLTVTPPWSALAYGVVQGLSSREVYEQSSATFARQILDTAAQKAARHGVDCNTRHVVEINPYQAILAVAEGLDCDLIVVGAHGRRGLERVLIGSETTKLLTHSKRPVLVWRGMPG
jgi:nucleotide-binding universal stress UspA family protein